MPTIVILGIVTNTSSECAQSYYSSELENFGEGNCDVKRRRKKGMKKGGKVGQGGRKIESRRRKKCTWRMENWVK